MSPARAEGTYESAPHATTNKMGVARVCCSGARASGLIAACSLLILMADAAAPPGRVGGRECVKMAIRDCDAIFGDVTRSHAISCAVTRCVPPKGL